MGCRRKRRKEICRRCCGRIPNILVIFVIDGLVCSARSCYFNHLFNFLYWRRRHKCRFVVVVGRVDGKVVVTVKTVDGNFVVVVVGWVDGKVVVVVVGRVDEKVVDVKVVVVGLLDLFVVEAQAIAVALTDSIERHVRQIGSSLSSGRPIHI